MELTAERKRSIRRRLEPLLAELDPEIQLIQVILDSSRQYLGIVVQKVNRPAILRFEFIRYISMPDSEVRDDIARQLRARGILPSDSQV